MAGKTFPVLFALSVLAVYSIVGTNNISAHAEFAKSGIYTCNPFARSLETNIYSNVIHEINDKMDLYLKTNPNSTMLQQHDAIMEDQDTWSLYNKSRACISDVIGANPDDIVPLNANVQQAIAVPEFGVLWQIISTIAIFGGIMVYRKFFE